MEIESEKSYAERAEINAKLEYINDAETMLADLKKAINEGKTSRQQRDDIRDATRDFMVRVNDLKREWGK